MKKNILIIGPGMEIGGVERSLLGLLNSIDYEKYEVDLFLLSHKGEFMPFINRKVNVLPENKSLSLMNWPITKLIRARHFYMAAIRLWSKFYGDFRAKLTKTKTLNVTICNRIVSEKIKMLEKHYNIALGFFGPHYLLENRVNADIKVGWVHTDYSNINELPDTKFTFPMWSKLDYVACVSEQVKCSFDSIYPSLSDKTIVVENILSVELIKIQSMEFDVCKEMANDGVIKILSVGRFCTAKAFDEVVVASSLLVERGYNFKWYLIGYGPDESLIRSKIEEYHMEAYVSILGKKNNPYPYMKACDIYAQPSRYEGKAVTVREAQILNKPVMITRFATSSSQVDEGIDGYICEMGAQGIADGIAYMLDHKEFRDELVRNTKKSNYDNAGEFSKLIEILKE